MSDEAKKTKEAVTAARAVSAAIGSGRKVPHESLTLAAAIARSEADAMVAQLGAERELREGLRDFLRNLSGEGLSVALMERRLRWLGLLDDVDRSSSIAEASRLARAAEVAGILLKDAGNQPPPKNPIPFFRRRRQ